jgi:dTDP-4-dehydrorhamnose reductase
MPRILVTGASGQVGLEMQRAPLPPGWTLITPAREDLDLLDTAAIAGAVAALQPDAIINAAAYTAVDKAESEPDLAFALNRDAPEALARAAAALDAPILHLSTDYVFDGEKSAPYVETDPRNPIGAYARSKAAGEVAVLDAPARAAIMRTSWVFSAHRANFVKTMLRLGEARDEVAVVADQHGRPTAAADLARACIAIADQLLARTDTARGIFHFANTGDATWADFAEAIFAGAAARGRHPVRVRRITTAEFPTPARRPANSRLDTTKIETTLGIRPRTWRDALNECLDELLRTAKPGP